MSSGRRRSAPPRVPVTDAQLTDTYRLIPARASDGGTVLSRLTGDLDRLSDLMELDDATNDRFLGEEGLLPGIGIHELVYGIRYAHIVNAAFTHPSPVGARFNSRARGAWYASLDRDTAVAEVAFFRLLQFAEIDWPHEENAVFDTYLADISCSLHDLRPGTPGRQVRANVRPLLAADPIPACYQAPQAFAALLMEQQSNGILYPSVRRTGGECLVCFRPALVYHVRRAARLELPLHAGSPFSAKDVREVPQPDI